MAKEERFLVVCIKEMILGSKWIKKDYKEPMKLHEILWLREDLGVEKFNEHLQVYKHDKDDQWRGLDIKDKS